MAELRVTRLSPSTAPVPTGGLRSDAARAAQAAFFQTALAASATAATTRPVATVQPTTTSLRSSSRPRDTFESRAAPPARLLRPGSLLDIKV